MVHREEQQDEPVASVGVQEERSCLKCGKPFSLRSGRKNTCSVACGSLLREGLRIAAEKRRKLMRERRRERFVALTEGFSASEHIGPPNRIAEALAETRRTVEGMLKESSAARSRVSDGKL